MKRLISIIVLSAFLTTSTYSLAPYQNSFLAAPSPMETPSAPAYTLAAPTSSGVLDPDTAANVSKALADVVAKLRQGKIKESKKNYTPFPELENIKKAKEIYGALFEAVLPFVQAGNELALAFLVVQAYQKLRKLNENQAQRLILVTETGLEKRLVSAVAMILFLIVILNLPGCVSWWRKPYPATHPAVIAAADHAYDHNDLSALKVLLRDSDQDIRLQAARMLNQIVDVEIRKSPADRELNVYDLGRELVLRIPAETEYPTRHLLIDALGKVLQLLRNNSSCADFKTAAMNLLWETYFVKLDQLALLRSEDTQMEETRAQIANREAEVEKIKQAMNLGGNPLTFASLFTYFKDVAARPTSDANTRLQNSAIAELSHRVLVPAEGAPEGSNPPVAGDVASLVELYSMDRFASDAQRETGKLWRLDILLHLGALVSPDNASSVVPLFLAALNKEDPYKEMALSSIRKLAQMLTPQSAFQGQEEMVTAVVGILNNPQSPVAQKTIAAQILNALRSIQAANGLQQFLALQNNVEIEYIGENLIQAYIEAVGINAEAIRTVVDRTVAGNRHQHGETLIRLLRTNQSPTVRTAAVLALGQIAEAQNVPSANDASINAVLLDELRVQRLLDDTATAAELREPLQAEIRAIQEVLPRLGFQNDYASLKARALDLSAERNMRAAMLIRIGRLLSDLAIQGAPGPDHAMVANDLRGLLNDVQREVVIQTLWLISRLNPDAVNQNAELVAAIIEKATVDIREFRIPAFSAMERLNMPHSDSAQAAVLNRLTDATIQEDEKLLCLNILIKWGRLISDVEDRRVSLEVEAGTAVTTLAQDASQPATVRDRAVQTLLVLAGAHAPKTRLQELLALVREGGVSWEGDSLRSLIENRIVKSEWDQVQRAFYSSLIQYSGRELDSYLDGNVPRVLNGPSIAAVLSVRFHEINSGCVTDRVLIALALLRMHNTDKLQFLIDQLNAGFLSADIAPIRTHIFTYLSSGDTPISVHHAVLACPSHDPELDRVALARLAREASPATVPILMARLPNEQNPESIASIAEALARATTDQQVLEVLRAALNRFDDLPLPEGMTGEARANYKARLMAVIISIMRARASSGGRIGRGNAEILDIWLKGSPRITNADIKVKITRAKVVASAKLYEARQYNTELTIGVGAALLRQVLKRVDSSDIVISAFNIHVENKSPDKKDDLFLLGNGAPDEVLLPLPLFDFELADQKAAERLARVLVHELLEGAKAEVLEEFPEITHREVSGDLEYFHHLIITGLENRVFPNSDLPQILPEMIQTELQKNKPFDDITLKSAIDAERGKVSDTLTDKELAAGKSPAEVQAAIREAFAGKKSTLEQKIVGELTLPDNYASPLTEVAVAAAESDALIALDAEVLAGKTSLPEWLQKAVRAGRVVFFGPQNSTLVDTSAFVANPAELEGKAKALANITKVVVMLTPSQMLANYPEGYGRANAVNGKDAFVAPLNPAYSIVIHLALAQELIRLEKFDVSQLSDAGKLLLALQLDTPEFNSPEGIAKMRRILSALGQIPSELIRDLKKKLREGLIDDVLKAA